MSITYTNKVCGYSIKLDDLIKKFNLIMKKQAKLFTTFTKSLINLNNGLRKNKKAEPDDFLKRFCQFAVAQEGNKEDLELASKFYAKSIEIEEDQGKVSIDLAEAYLGRAKLHHKQQEAESTKSALEKCKEIPKKLGLYKQHPQVKEAEGLVNLKNSSYRAKVWFKETSGISL